MKKILIISMIVFMIFGCEKWKKNREFNKILKQEEKRLKEERNRKKSESKSEITPAEIIPVEEAKEEIPSKSKLEKADEIKEIVKTEETEQKNEAIQNDLIPEDEHTEIEVKLPGDLIALADKDLSISELWKGYRESKDSLKIAQKDDNFQKMIIYVKRAAEYAILLKRDDIAAWQLNNIGYFSIEEFKRRTNYSERMNNLNTMASGEDKRKYYSSTKNMLQEEFPVLEDAIEYLSTARGIDQKLNDPSRTKIIQNNLDFIIEIQKFIK